MIRVLRLKTGTKIVIFNGQGSAAKALLTLNGSDAEATVEELLKAPDKPKTSFALAWGLTKGEKSELILRTATELGTRQLQPLACRHSVVKLDAKRAAKRAEQWEAALLGACKQCERADLPILCNLMSSEQFFASSPDKEPGEGGATLRILLEARRDLPPLSSVLRLNQKNPRRVVLCIGPEGGWNAEELNLAKENGFIGASLGQYVLRAETASITAMALAADWAAEYQH